jgi:hypothetical protein
VLEQHSLLTLPGVAVERIAVNQNDRLSVAMVVVVDLNIRAVSVPTFTNGMVLLSFDCSFQVSPESA